MTELGTVEPSLIKSDAVEDGMLQVSTDEPCVAEVGFVELYPT